VDLPKQSTSRRATIAFRDRVSIMADEASGGSSQPSYTSEVAPSLPAEVIQTSGGEYVRGKQVEAITVFVVCLRFNPSLMFTAKCQVTILSGVYQGQVIYVHRVLYENEHGRPAGIQLHCKRTED
jgi:hypothetical protein